MLSRVRIVALLALVVLAFLPATPVAQAQGEEPAAVTITPLEEAVNVRSGPGPEFMIRGTLYPGFSLTATGRTDFPVDFQCSGVEAYDAQAWLRVDLVEGVEGWINLCVVEVTGDYAVLPVAAPAFPVLIDQAEFVQLTAEGWTPENPAFAAELSAAVIVHEYPTLGSTILGVIQAGETVEVLAVSDPPGWLKIRYGEAEGWIVSFVVALTEDQVAALPVINLADLFADLLANYLDQEGAGACQNPPPPWAPAHGWRRQCEGIDLHTYEPEPPPGHQRGE